jgi:hypothetical protein
VRTRSDPFRSWLATSIWRHALAIASIALLATLRWNLTLLAGVAHGDESVYFRAFDLVARGKSPYYGHFYYAPIFAYLGARLQAAVGFRATLIGLRMLNLVGLATLVWCAFAWSRMRTSTKLSLAAAFVWFAPAVALTLRWGNLSPIASALIVVALILLERSSLPANDSAPLLGPSRAITAATSLAVSILIKPIAAVVPFLIAGARRGETRRSARASLITAGLALAVAATGFLAMPFFAEFLAARSDPGAIGRSTSLQRVIYCFGLRPPPLVVLVVVLALAIFVARRACVMDSGTFIAFVTATALLATPIVWSHTLLLTLPAQVMAIERAWVRRQPATVSWYELPLVVLACSAIQFSEGVGGLESQPLPVQGIVVTITCLAPAALFLYLMTTQGRPRLPWATPKVAEL